MHWTLRAMTVLILGGLLLSGCQALTGKTLGENIDDAAITTTVKTKLAAEKAVTLTRVGVETEKGVVYLTGVVDSAALKERAGEIARKVGGVREVVNNVRVQAGR